MCCAHLQGVLHDEVADGVAHDVDPGLGVRAAARGVAHAQHALEQLAALARAAIAQAALEHARLELVRGPCGRVLLHNLDDRGPAGGGKTEIVKGAGLKEDEGACAMCKQKGSTSVQRNREIDCTATQQEAREHGI